MLGTIFHVLLDPSDRNSPSFYIGGMDPLSEVFDSAVRYTSQSEALSSADLIKAQHKLDLIPACVQTYPTGLYVNFTVDGDDVIVVYQHPTIQGPHNTDVVTPLPRSGGFFNRLGYDIQKYDVDESRTLLKMIDQLTYGDIDILIELGRHRVSNQSPEMTAILISENLATEVSGSCIITPYGRGVYQLYREISSTFRFVWTKKTNSLHVFIGRLGCITDEDPRVMLNLIEDSTTLTDRERVLLRQLEIGPMMRGGVIHDNWMTVSTLDVLIERGYIDTKMYRIAGAMLSITMLGRKLLTTSNSWLMITKGI